MLAPLKERWYEWARQESEPPALPSDDKLALLLEVNYPAHLHDVLSTIRKLGHGGTVLVVPDRECKSLSCFCAAYPRGVAFVCSQDGSIKCVRNRDGKVTLYE
jgi:hypothetical protein